jgi:hypothetical protein
MCGVLTYYGQYAWSSAEAKGGPGFRSISGFQGVAQLTTSMERGPPSELT